MIWRGKICADQGGTDAEQMADRAQVPRDHGAAARAPVPRRRGEVYWAGA